ATLVLVIVAAAHVGLYLLLTQEARSELRAIEGRHSEAALRTAKRPDAPPQPGTPDYERWRAQVELHEDAKAWEIHERHVGLLRGGFLASFLAQVGITVWILLKLLAKQRRLSGSRRARD
nr:hypothetical protein [Planctomycetota bacterium]